MSKFTRDTAGQFYDEHRGKPFFEGIVSEYSSDVSVGMELVAPDAITKWRQVIGPTKSEVARQEAPESVRAKFGGEGPRNAVHGSDSEPSYKRES